MDEKKQDVLFGSLLIFMPICLAVCSLIHEFKISDVIYLVGVAFIAIQYIMIYRKNHR